MHPSNDHPNEPSINELKRRRDELITAPSTNENMKKIEAIEKQIKRHETQVGV
jgi:hypothetical protein